MAETKRAAVATPRPGPSAAPPPPPPTTSSPGPPADLLKTLANASGARIRITLGPNHSLEGTLFTLCPALNVLALRTSPAGQKGDYRVVPLARVRDVAVLSAAQQEVGRADWTVSKADVARGREREEERVARWKDEEKKVGKGVTKEAQALFYALDRMYAARWHGTDIVVDESVVVAAPYTPESCRAPKDKQQSLAHIRRVVEGERRKILRGGSPLPRKGG